MQLVSDASRYLNCIIRAIVFALERPTAGAGATVSVYTFFGLFLPISDNKTCSAKGVFFDVNKVR